MQIDLQLETEAWLRDRLATGNHGSIGELIETLIAEHKLAELAIDDDDHLWAKPAIDDALSSLQRGEGSSLADVAQRLKGRLTARTSS